MISCSKKAFIGELKIWKWQLWPALFEQYLNTQTRVFFMMTADCCINVCRMSRVQVRFSGTMAQVTHARTQSFFTSLLFFHGCTSRLTQSDRVQPNYFQPSLLFSPQPWLFAWSLLAHTALVLTSMSHKAPFMHGIQANLGAKAWWLEEKVGCNCSHKTETSD